MCLSFRLACSPVRKRVAGESPRSKIRHHVGLINPVGGEVTREKIDSIRLTRIDRDVWLVCNRSEGDNVNT